MPAQITSIDVFGYNGNGKVKRGSRDWGQEEANQRFNNLKPNRVRITGHDLDELTERAVVFTYSTGGHSFAVLELVVRDDNNKILDVYFVVWSPENEYPLDEFSLGNLTVTVETVDTTGIGESGTQNSVTIED